MFDDTEWDVDDTARSLDRSLFGSVSKKLQTKDLKVSNVENRLTKCNRKKENVSHKKKHRSLEECATNEEYSVKKKKQKVTDSSEVRKNPGEYETGNKCTKVKDGVKLKRKVTDDGTARKKMKIKSAEDLNKSAAKAIFNNEETELTKTQRRNKRRKELKNSSKQNKRTNIISSKSVLEKVVNNTTKIVKHDEQLVTNVVASTVADKKKHKQLVAKSLVDSDSVKLETKGGKNVTVNKREKRKIQTIGKDKKPISIQNNTENSAKKSLELTESENKKLKKQISVKNKRAIGKQNTTQQKAAGQNKITMIERSFTDNDDEKIVFEIASKTQLTSFNKTVNKSMKAEDADALFLSEPPVMNRAKLKKLSLMDRMKEKLNSARFRYINEQLYTTTGAEAEKMFADDHNAFEVYHKGYSTQVSKWPLDPLSIIQKQILMRHWTPNIVIADMGCGSARLAQSLKNAKVHSFDLVAANKLVTACNMSKVPLSSGSVDVVVFCLSLMGTNLADYLKEANRILKIGGVMKIAEVGSRFQKIGEFISEVEQLGFDVICKEMPNKMFYVFDFKKVKNFNRQLENLQIHLDPCVYKKR